MDLINILIAIVTFGVFFLGVATFFKNKKNPLTHAFSILVAVIVVWSISMLFFRISESNAQVAHWAKMLYLSAGLIPVSYLYLVFIFVHKKVPKKTKAAIVGPFAVLFAVFLLPNTLIRGGTFIEGGHNIINFGWASWLYVIYFSTYFALGIYFLYKKYIKTSGTEKMQALYLMIGSAIPIILGSSSNLYPPHFGYFGLNWLGNVSIIFFVLFIAYAILRHQMFNVRVIATEIFAALLIISFLANVLVADTVDEFMLRGGMFVMVTIFALMLVRSTIREIETLRALSEQKTEFVSIASHQLRTPISIIKGYMDMLREGNFGKMSDKQLEVINKSYGANERMRALVEDFLNLTRAEKGTLKFNFEKINISQIISKIVVDQKPSAQEKGLTLNWHSPEKPIYIDVDAAKIEELVSNLIDNALKYTKKGGVAIRVTEDNIKQVVRIFVKDTGMGIDPKEKNDIFESFRRGKDGESANAGGAGLGLHIAKMIAEGHGGRIWVESKGKGQGSEFIVELPLSTIHKAQIKIGKKR